MRKYLILFFFLTTPCIAQVNVQAISATGTVSLQTKSNLNTLFNITLTGNVSSASIDTGFKGQQANFNICQNSVGGFTWTWPGTFQGTSTITIATGASACTQAQFINVDGTTWQSVGGGSGGGISSPTSAGQLDPTQAPYNVKADAFSNADGVTVNGQNTLNSATKSCVAADAGKLAIVVSTGNGSYPFGAGLVTVSSCSGNAWVLSTTANGNAGSNQNFAIGSNAPGGNGAQLHQAQIDAFAAHKTIALPCGNIILESPPFVIATNSIAVVDVNADLKGCLGGGTHWFLHPQITSTILTGGTWFAQFVTSGGLPGAITEGNGLGGQAKVSDFFFTSLGGAIPCTSGTHNIINSYPAVQNVAMQLIGTTNACLTPITVNAGEAHLGWLNLQTFSQNGLINQAGVTAISMGGQGQNTVFDSIFAFGGIGISVACGGSMCAVLNDYITATAEGVECTGASCTIDMENTFCNVFSGGGHSGCIKDNGNSSLVLAFANILSEAVASQGVVQLTNAGSVLDISGTKVTATTAGFEVTGSGQVNDRAGNTWAHPLTQLTGQCVPIGGGSVAFNWNAGREVANTNFGANLAVQTPFAASICGATYDVKIGLRQTTLGVGCGAGSNTVNGTLNWTSGGLAQSATLNTLTVSANGTLGTSSNYQSIPIHVDINTAITFVATNSTLASAGCSTIPQYSFDVSNI